MQLFISRLFFLRFLLLLFITMPILEMWLLIEVGSRIGALPTIGLVFLTAMIGLGLLRQQGFNTLLRANQKLEGGELPATEVMEGIMLAVGGALLLTPGFVTDAIGFACLIPVTRRLLAGRFLKHMTVVGMSSQQAFYTQKRHSSSPFEEGDVFEGEFHRDSEQNDRKNLP